MPSDAAHHQTRTGERKVRVPSQRLFVKRRRAIERLGFEQDVGFVFSIFGFQEKIVGLRILGRGAR